MKILVLMKQVANKDAILRINKDSTWIEETDLSFEVSESDGYALEEALRIKEKVGGEVTAVEKDTRRPDGIGRHRGELREHHDPVLRAAATSRTSRRRSW